MNILIEHLNKLKITHEEEKDIFLKRHWLSRVNDLEEAIKIYGRLQKGLPVEVDVGHAYKYVITSLDQLAECALIHPGMNFISSWEIEFVDW